MSYIALMTVETSSYSSGQVNWSSHANQWSTRLTMEDLSELQPLLLLFTCAFSNLLLWKGFAVHRGSLTGLAGTVQLDWTIINFISSTCAGITHQNATIKIYIKHLPASASEIWKLVCFPSFHDILNLIALFF